ncbi:hypothetical protein [uncultured Subdoligranulum sp.]|uniref:hypothetical protein n=1 Tax=uncultured Subdoligranulum sp. TaxID=512298 RepID=UPI00263864F5|nr:hypothetical protein [uncultured Subdoligranulum sp.]
MIYHTNPRKQRQYDRSDYRLEPYWIQRRPVRNRRLVLAVAIPLVCGVGAYLATAGEDAFQRVNWTMIAALLPGLILWPIAIITWKNDRAACRGVAICRWDDKLDLQPKRLIYSYRDRRDGRRGLRYESSVPYSLLDRILYFPDRSFLVLWCGGIDTVYEASGAAIKHTNYWTGFGKIIRSNHRVFLPMVYDDNEAVLRELETLSATPVERYPGTDAEIPPDKPLQNPPQV